MKSVSILTFSLFAFILLAFTPVNTTTWKADSGHAYLGFTVKYMGLIDFRGTFSSFDATITTSKEDFSDATVELTGDVKSIFTGNDGRDNHLRSADFFDAEKYPQFTFKSTSFKKTGENVYTVSGPMTFHGVTKDISLTAYNTGISKHPSDNTPITGFKITGTFKRLDFGISPDSPPAFLSDEVTLEADVIFAKAQ